MTVRWPEGVSDIPRRDGSQWEETLGFVEDETLSGKKKRRMSHSQSPRPFSTSLLFKTVAEYERFSYWYNNVCMRGLYGFVFPKIDSESKPSTVYRFTSPPQYTNVGGTVIKCTFNIEEATDA